MEIDLDELATQASSLEQCAAEMFRQAAELRGYIAAHQRTARRTASTDIPTDPVTPAADPPPDHPGPAAPPDDDPVAKWEAAFASSREEFKLMGLDDSDAEAEALRLVGPRPT